MNLLTRFMLDYAGAFLASESGALAATRLLGTHIAPTIPDPDPEASANIVISLVRASPARVTPCSFFLLCTANNMGAVVQPDLFAGYDPSASDLEYIWDIENQDDAGWADEVFDYVDDLPAEFQVKGRAYGKKIGRVLDAPAPTLGYRTRCTVVRISDGYSETSDWFDLGIVVDPDDYFAENETIYVAPSGETGDAPTPNGGVYTTLDAARDRIEADPAGTGSYRVRIKRGFTYTERFTCPQDGATCVTWMLDAWGSGDKPVLSPSSGGTAAIQTGRSDQQESVTGWHIRDVDVVRSMNGETISIGYHRNNRVGAIWNSRIEGDARYKTNAPWPAGPSGDATGWLAAANCQFLKLHGIWGLDLFGNAHCVIGSVYEHDPDAPAAHPIPDSGREGYGIRWHGDKWLNQVSQCRLFMRSGWFDNVPSIQTTQDMFRLGTNDRAGQFIHIERCLLEGSRIIVQLTEGDGAVGNILIERNLMIGVHDTVVAVNSGFAGTTVRNNLYVRPPSEPAQGAGNGNYQQRQFVTLSGTLTTDQRATPTKVYNNTFINLGEVAASVFELITNSAGLTALDVANNVYHYPYATNATPVDAGPFTLTALYEPLYKGYWDTETPTGNITEEAEYLIGFNSLVGTFQAGETVTGGTSGSSRVFTRYHPDYGPGRMCFETPLINTGPITTNRFVAGETLTGQTSGATCIVASTVQQGTRDTGLYDTLLIPRTVTPTHVIAYDAQSGAFTEGETLTNGTATAYICRVYDDGTTGLLWLRDVVGTFADNDSLTDGDTGAATANGGPTISGCGAYWVQDTIANCGAGTTAAATDFFGELRPPTLTSRKVGAFQGAI